MLSANLLAASSSESHLDEGTPTSKPRSFLLTRQETETLILAARRAVSGGPLYELKRVIESVNIDV